MATRIRDSKVFEVTTTNATPVDTAIVAVPTNSICVVTSHIVARTSSGVRATFNLYGSAGREASTATLVSLAMDIIAARKDASAAAWLAVTDASTNDVVIRVTGALATTVTWVIFSDIKIYTP